MIYILTEIKEFNGEWSDPEIKGATTELKLAERWQATSSYVYGEIHQIMMIAPKNAETVVRKAEKLEEERDKGYGDRLERTTEFRLRQDSATA